MVSTDETTEDPYLRCPKCLTRLDQVFLCEIPIERCPDCDGIWLDAGELDLIMQRERSNEGSWFAKFLGRLEK